jgi:parallel beta helix pectate lyase-like protein
METETRNRVLVVATTLVGVGVFGSSTLEAGDLTPPPGAVASTMKTLVDLDPRVVVNDLPGAPNAVYLIDQDGDYVVTAELVTAGPGQHGILVTANDVTIDLNGFTVRGAPGSLDGVHVSPVALTSGTEIDVSSWSWGMSQSGSITGFGGNGVRVVDAARVRLAGLRVTNSGGDGVSLSALTGTNEYLTASMEDCVVTSCGGNGITAENFRAYDLARVTTAGNAAHGVLVRGTGYPPPPPGEPIGGVNISIEQIPGPVVSTSNGGDGIRFEFDATSQPVVTMKRAKTNHNKGNGVNAVSLTTNTEYDFDLNDVEASSNTGGGLVVSGQLDIQGATVRNNGGNGIDYFAPGEPVKGVDVYLRSVVGSSNSGSGASLIWPSISGPSSLTVRDSIFTHNSLDGLFFNDMDADDDGVRSFDSIVASNNGGAGFVLRTLDKSSPMLHKGLVASGNTGKGFDQIGGSARYEVCSADNNGSDGFALVGQAFILDSSSSQSNMGDGFNVIADTVSISNTRSVGNTGDGVDLAPGEPVKGVNVSIEQVPGGFVNNGGNGILVVTGTLTLKGGAVSGNGGSGISAFDSSLYFSDVTITDNLTSGLVVSDAVRLHVVDSIIDNNTGNGLVTSSSAVGLTTGPVTLRRNSFTGNTSTGCTIADSVGGQVTECTAFSNGFLGIEVLSLGHVLTGNVASANAAGNVFAVTPGNAVGPSVGAATISTDNNFANQRP